MNYEDFRSALLTQMEASGVSKADLRAAFIEEMEASEEWTTIYHRIYQGTGKYGSPKRVAETYYTATYWAQTEPRAVPAAMRTVYCAACQAKENGFPIFFVDHQLLSAVLNTDPPSGVRWSEMKLPFEAGIFSLPRGSLRYIDGSDVNHLGWLRVQKGKTFRFNERSPIISVPNDAFSIYAQPLNDEGTVLFSNLDGEQRPYIDSNIIEDHWRGTFDLPFASGDDDFLRICRSLVFGLLMVMNARPQLVSHGRREGKQSKRAKSGREFWTPNIIGRDYRARREHQGGSHRTPREGWRRGHYTHQPIGSIKNNPDFISAASLPRLYEAEAATWRIDWASVDDDTRAKFWRNHYHHWLEPIWIDGEA